MIEKIIEEEEFCEGCPQAHDCKSAYGMLGNFKGPSVVTRVIVAFLLPILVFIVVLGVSGHMMRVGVRSENLRVAASSLLAGGASIICVLISRAILSWKSKRRAFFDKETKRSKQTAS